MIVTDDSSGNDNDNHDIWITLNQWAKTKRI